MKNVVSKTILKTVAAVIIALFVAFGTASLGFPQHMATLFEKMGAYSFATGYASLAYTYKGSADNLARCFNDSIFAGDDSNIINFGGKLIAREDFEEYAEKKSEELKIDYLQLVYGNVARSKYNRGDKEGALITASEALEKTVGFPQNNALVALALRAYEKDDSEFSADILSAVRKITPTADQQEYYDAVIAYLS